jgi:hypothetical protein
MVPTTWIEFCFETLEIVETNSPVIFSAKFASSFGDCEEGV